MRYCVEIALMQGKLIICVRCEYGWFIPIGMSSSFCRISLITETNLMHTNFSNYNINKTGHILNVKVSSVKQETIHWSIMLLFSRGEYQAMSHLCRLCNEEERLLSNSYTWQLVINYKVRGGKCIRELDSTLLCRFSSDGTFCKPSLLPE